MLCFYMCFQVFYGSCLIVTLMTRSLVYFTVFDLFVWSFVCRLCGLTASKSLTSCSYVYVNHSWIDLKCLFRYDVFNVVKSQKLHLLCAELLWAESTVCWRSRSATRTICCWLSGRTCCRPSRARTTDCWTSSCWWSMQAWKITISEENPEDEENKEPDNPPTRKFGNGTI